MRWNRHGFAKNLSDLALGLIIFSEKVAQLILSRVGILGREDQTKLLKLPFHLLQRRLCRLLRRWGCQ